MTSPALEDLELVLSPAVRRAANHFAAVLAETPQFKKLEQATEALDHDQSAQEAIAAFQAKQQSLKAMLMLKAVSDGDRTALESLRQAVLNHPTFAAYLQAQNDVAALCEAAADVLSGTIGLSFSAACKSGCC